MSMAILSEDLGLRTSWNSTFTARSKAASLWIIFGVGDLTRNRVKFSALPGDRLEETPGVGMSGLTEEGLNWSCFNHLSSVHHQDPINILSDQAQIMGDQQQRHTPSPALLFKQLHELGLDADIQSRRWLIGDEKERITGKRDGHERSLSHPP